MSLIARIRNKITGILSPHFLGREQIALVEMSGAVLEEAQEQTDESIAGVQAQINVLRSEEGAGLIGIEDADGHFSSENVEGALEELAERDISSENITVAGEWNFLQPVGLSNSGFVANLTAATLTADRTYTFKNASGTVAFLTDIPAQVNLIAGSNINITGTYPNLTISGTGGDGGTGVSTVNGMVGDVVLDYASVGAAPTSHTHTIAQVTGLQTALNSKANSTHTHSAGDITSGVFSTARLGTGTANSSRFLRGDGTWAEPPSGGGGGGGTVTSVNVSGGTGISATGGPITSSGTISLALSTNLQSWSGINPNSKANTSAIPTSNNYVATSGTQNNLSGNKGWTGVHTFNSSVTVVGSINGQGAVFGESFRATNGSGDLSSAGTGDGVRLMPNGFSTTNMTNIAGNGNMTVRGTVTATNLTATSDTRLKFNITRKEPRQELLEFIKLYGWKWINSKKEGLGVLAQDVQAVAPEYVVEGEDGMLAVDKAGLAIEMVMALAEKIDGSSD